MPVVTNEQAQWPGPVRAVLEVVEDLPLPATSRVGDQFPNRPRSGAASAKGCSEDVTLRVEDHALRRGEAAVIIEVVDHLFLPLTARAKAQFEDCAEPIGATCNG